MATITPATWLTSALARLRSFFTKASPEYFFQRARRHFKKGKHEKAIADFSAAIRLDPNNAIQYHWRAWCFCEKGDFDKAIADFTEALRLDENVADEIIADLDETIRLDPNDADAFYNCGACWFLKGEPENAIADLTEAIRLGHPRAAQACNYRGVCHFGKGLVPMNRGEYDLAVPEFLAAIEDFSEAIRLDPNLAVAYYNRGRCRINLTHHYATRASRDKGHPVPALTGEQDKAGTDVPVEEDDADPQPNTYALAPNTNAPIESLGRELIDLAEVTVPATVIDLVPELIVRNNVVLPLSFDNGVLRLVMSDRSDSEMLQKLQYIFIADEVDNQLRAQMPREVWGCMITAIEPLFAPRAHIIEAINRHYVQWETKSVGAEFADAIGRTVAIDDFTEAILLDPNEADNYFWRARSYGETERDQAIADYTEAIRLDPKGTVAFVERGHCHEQNGEHDRAIADFTEAIRLDPNAAADGLSPHCERGRSYEQIGEHDKAIADFKEALRLYTLPFHGEGAALLAHLNEAIRLHPNVADHYFWRGRFYKMFPLDDRENSEFELSLDDQSIDEATPNPEPTKAQVDFTKAIELDPTVADYYYWRAEVSGQGHEAIADLTEAIRLDPNKDEAYFNRGHSFCQTGELDKAIADYTEVLRLLESQNAQNSDIFTREDLMRETYYYRGLAYQQRGRDRSSAEDVRDIDENDFELSLDTGATPKATDGGESDHEKGRADEVQWKRLSSTFGGQFNPARIGT